MSQNVTNSDEISPAQALAIEALLLGQSVTEAAEEAGVARETVSRWRNHDPVFMAALQNARAENAAQTRCALEAIGKEAVGTLLHAMRAVYIQPTRLRAACAALKLLGANQVVTLPFTTPEEVHAQLRQREEEARKSLCKTDEDEKTEPRAKGEAEVEDKAKALAEARTEVEAKTEAEPGDHAHGTAPVEVEGTTVEHDQDGASPENEDPAQEEKRLVKEWSKFAEDILEELHDPDSRVSRSWSDAVEEGHGGNVTELLRRAVMNAPRLAPPIPDKYRQQNAAGQ